MTILKCDYHKYYIKYGFMIAVICIMNFYHTAMAGAQVELPQMAAPVLETPQLPAIPMPKMPEIKLIDTDKISQEIEEHARIKQSEEKKQTNDHDTDKSDSKNDSKKSQAYDKIRDNKYIKRDNNNDDKKETVDAKKQQVSAALPETEQAQTDKKNQQPDAAGNVSAKDLLQSHFLAVMFYIFAKTSLAAIILWTVFLFVNKRKSAVIETIVFFVINIIGSMLYFSFVAKMENGVWHFAGQAVLAREFGLIIGAFAGCMLFMAGLISAAMVLWPKNNKL
ncbi:hypothetical protein HNR32_000995 [Pectinatus brassicae]|uniref:Uncharacterized protein n=2 Tax=Pectinatus brassicae TaxID=862415 RepID=A0A840UDR4_9FIRM|nr:hypothetical protein [Pectinatus brassicae]MBB5335861.1 hypothetical protein [Pectinatus brassicae]